MVKVQGVWSGSRIVAVVKGLQKSRVLGIRLRFNILGCWSSGFQGEGLVLQGFSSGAHFSTEELHEHFR